MEKYIKAYLLNSIFLFAAILFITYGFFNLDFLQGNNIDEYTNNYCQLNPSSLICKNKYKKNKFIWIFVDGNAYDQLVLLQNKTKYRIPIIFRGKGQGYKHTSPLFSEMFSGVVSRNMFYNELKTDHIFKQLHNANYTMNYLGINAPVNKLCGVKSDTFKNRRVLKKHELCSFCDFCNLTYNIEDSWCQNYYKSIINRDGRLLPEINKKKIYSDLDYHFIKDNKDILEDINLNDCFKKTFFEFNGKESLVYYNTEIDKYNHLLTKDHIKTISEEYNTEKWIIKIMKWIDEHPDYALIVNSDHGGQKFYGEDDINNHGLDIDGNEAIIFIYTKEFKDNYDKLKLDNIYYNKLDPSSIISQIFENVNIPLQSEGISYPIGNDSLFRYVAYKSKEVQLINQLNVYKHKYPSYEISLNKIIYKIENSEFHKVEEENYEKYFNEKFTEKAINFIKEIQKEITNILNDKNKNIFNHFILFLGISIIFTICILYHIYEIYQIVKEDEIKFVFYLFILFISLFIIPFIYCFAKELTIYNRINLAILVTPFCLFICNIMIKLYFSQSDTFKSSMIILLFGIISMIFHYSNTIIYLKKIFSSIVNSRILNAAVLYPILFFELNYDLKKNYLNTNLQILKYPIYKVIRVIYYSYIILIFFFDMSTENYFVAHTPFNYFITISIYTLLVTIFIIAELIIKFNKENHLNSKNDELLKIILFLYEFFINDESNRLMILIMFILLEYFSDFFYTKQKNINKVIISIIIININEIFHLLVNRVYSFETTKKYFSRTITYSIETSKIYVIILEIFYKARIPFISLGYFLKMNLFGNSYNKESLILRYILNIRCNINFIFFAYQFVYLKNNADYITLMMYCFVDLSLFLLDFINFIFSFFNVLVTNNGYKEIKSIQNK